MQVKRKQSPHANVDLVPMIDVVFQLILFFLVSTTFAVLPGINVNLPVSSTAKGTSAAGITITASADGKLYFNEDPVSYDALDSMLSSFDTAQTPKEEYPVTLEADSDVKNGQIVQVFDVIRKNGFSAVNLRTSKK